MTPFQPKQHNQQVANLKYVRAAELKHGRVAMLAFAGWVASQVRLKGKLWCWSMPVKLEALRGRLAL